MQNKITLFWNIASQPSRAVKALLDISKVPYNNHFVDLANNQTRSPEYLAKNPLGQVPFIIDEEEGLGIGESNAIVVYLCQKFKGEIGNYYAQSITDAAKLNMYLSWYQGYYRPRLMGIINLKKYRYKVAKQSFSEQQYNIALDKQREALRSLDDRLKGKQYLQLDRLTIVDLLFFFETANLYYHGEQALFDENQNVKRWYKRIGEVPQVNAIQSQWHKNVVEKFKGLLNQIKPGQQPKL